LREDDEEDLQVLLFISSFLFNFMDLVNVQNEGSGVLVDEAMIW
jgi:hypothetical protein